MVRGVARNKAGLVEEERESAVRELLYFSGYPSAAIRAAMLRLSLRSAVIIITPTGVFLSSKGRHFATLLMTQIINQLPRANFSFITLPFYKLDAGRKISVPMMT